MFYRPWRFQIWRDSNSVAPCVMTRGLSCLSIRSERWWQFLDPSSKARLSGGKDGGQRHVWASCSGCILKFLVCRVRCRKVLKTSCNTCSLTLSFFYAQTTSPASSNWKPAFSQWTPPVRSVWHEWNENVTNEYKFTEDSTQVILGHILEEHKQWGFVVTPCFHKTKKNDKGFYM